MPASSRVLGGTRLAGEILRLFMNVVISGLYAVIIWLSLMAYLVIIDGPWLWALFASPFIISGVIVALLALDAAVRGAHWLWRCRATWRWRRSGTPGRG